MKPIWQASLSVALSDDVFVWIEGTLGKCKAEFKVQKYKDKQKASGPTRQDMRIVLCL